jgi:hypothetical protein
MTRASLDTNVIIHLYKAGFESVLFNRFGTCVVHEFIRTVELERHAGSSVLERFDDDIKAGKIEIIGDEYLKTIGMHRVFLDHVKEQEILYSSKDMGEVYAIALARTLGCMCIVTDDIKEQGPHYMLMRTPHNDILPLAFYEVLLLDYLQGITAREQFVEIFDLVCQASGMKLNLRSKLGGFQRRFWTSPYRTIECDWMKNFCSQNEIQPRMLLDRLFEILPK